MPRVRILSTGGTIASTADDADESGKTPTLSGDDVRNAAPTVDDHAEIDVEDVCRVSGFQMTFEHVGAVADAVERAVADGVDGVVVTHGTDTIEETAYVLDLVVPGDADDTDVPIVCTGAQRPADQLGTDGPANLLAAVRTVADGRFREAGGAYVVFDDEVHAARRVTKAHTTKLSTFASPGVGPVAEFTPDGPRFFREPGSESASIPGTRVDPDVRVELVTNTTGADGRQVERALESETDLDGLVVAGTGLGNVTAALGDALVTAMDDGVPVVLTSRCYAGTTAALYGGPGGAATLRDAGVILGGGLEPWKARVKLALARSTDADDEEIRSLFERTDAIRSS